MPRGTIAGILFVQGRARLAMGVRTISALNGGPLPARTLDVNALQTLYCRAVALGLPIIGNWAVPLLFYTCLNPINYTCFELICKRRRSKPPG